MNFICKKYGKKADELDIGFFTIELKYLYLFDSMNYTYKERVLNSSYDPKVVVNHFKNKHYIYQVINDKEIDEINIFSQGMDLDITNYEVQYEKR
jgi:hypothetical protein